MVKINADGSRSVYKFDDARHKCLAITTGEDGTLREKIHYDLDDMGRFSVGQIFGPMAASASKADTNTTPPAGWRKKSK